jgi:hypothetical protein
MHFQPNRRSNAFKIARKAWMSAPLRERRVM